MWLTLWQIPAGCHLWDPYLWCSLQLGQTNAVPLKRTLCSLVIFLPYGSSYFTRVMVVGNISSNVESLNMHLPSLHHGFICDQLREAEPLLKPVQTESGPLLMFKRVWLAVCWYTKMFQVVLWCLINHAFHLCWQYTIVKMLIITPTISSGRVNSMGKVLIAYFHMAKIRNYWKSPMKFCFYEISRPKILRYIKLQFTDFCINKTRSTATCEICLLLEEKKKGTVQN